MDSCCRYEGLSERTLGKQAAEKIRDFEGDEKRVGARPGTKITRNHHIPYQTEDPRQHRH